MSRVAAGSVDTPTIVHHHTHTHTHHHHYPTAAAALPTADAATPAAAFFTAATPTVAPTPLGSALVSALPFSSPASARSFVRRLQAAAADCTSRLLRDDDAQGEVDDESARELEQFTREWFAPGARALCISTPPTGDSVECAFTLDDQPASQVRLAAILQAFRPSTTRYLQFVDRRTPAEAQRSLVDLTAVWLEPTHLVVDTNARSIFLQWTNEEGATSSKVGSTAPATRGGDSLSLETDSGEQSSRARRRVAELYVFDAEGRIQTINTWRVERVGKVDARKE